MSTEAADRLRRFHAFMVDTTERDAAKAEQELEAAKKAIEQYCQLPSAVAITLEQIRAADAELAHSIDVWINHGTAQAVATVRWLDGCAEEQTKPVSSELSATLNDCAQQLRQKAARIDAATLGQ